MEKIVLEKLENFLQSAKKKEEMKIEKDQNTKERSKGDRARPYFGT